MSSKPKVQQTQIAAAIQADPPKSLAVSPSFDTLPDSAFIRESQLVQSPKRPNTPAPLPFSAPTLWRLVKSRNFPAPVKLSQRVTAWQVGSVRTWIKAHMAAAPAVEGRQS